MSQPRTYMYVAPGGSTSRFGQSILSSTLIAGLQRLDSRLQIPMPSSIPHWYPGKDVGQTCIWLGEPSKPKSIKVCAFHLGAVPEYTQVAENGMIMARGWRSIFEQVMRRTAITRTALEREFRVRLEHDGTDGYCAKCAKVGHRVKADSARNLCSVHAAAQQAAVKSVAGRQMIRHILEKEAGRWL